MIDFMDWKYELKWWWSHHTQKNGATPARPSFVAACTSVGLLIRWSRKMSCIGDDGITHRRTVPRQHGHLLLQSASQLDYRFDEQKNWVLLVIIRLLLQPASQLDYRFDEPKIRVKVVMMTSHTEERCHAGTAIFCCSLQASCVIIALGT